MAKIVIEMEIFDEYVDPADPTGITSAAWESIFEALSPFGEDIDIKGGA